MVTFLFKYSLKTNSKLTLTPNHLTNNQGLVKYLLNFKHKGEPNDVKFQMKTIGRFKSAMNRQIDEGVRIQNKKPESLLNSKSEFYGPAVKRKIMEG